MADVAARLSTSGLCVKPPPFSKNKYGGACSFMADTIYGRFVYGVDFAGLFYSQTPNGNADHSTLAEARAAAVSAFSDYVLAQLGDAKA